MTSLVQQIVDFWQNQSLARKITMIALFASAIIVTATFLVWANQTSYAVAYTGLSEKDSGAIVAKLTEQGIEYQLKDTSTILVPSDKVYDARLAMAQAGLPASSSVGYELFNANSLVMTEFTQKVNYQRALEGELERTIGSMAAIKAVRVHLVTPEKTLLTEAQQNPTASVTLQVKEGQGLDSSQVRAITHLVASSVQGLKSQDVVVVDDQGNMLAGGDQSGAQAVVSETDAQRVAEKAVSTDIEKKVQKMLDEILGPSKSVVKATVELDWTRRDTTAQSFDPKSTVVRSEQNTKENYTTAGNTQGIPGAQTNLPQPTLPVGDNNQVYEYARADQTTNYEVSQTQLHEVGAVGVIKKVSLSVMVDNIEDQAQLDTLRSAISAAAGIDQAKRGDVLSVGTLAFDRSAQNTAQAEEQQQTQLEMILSILKVALPVIIVGMLLFFLWRLFKNLRLSSEEAWTPVMQPISEVALNAPSGQPAALIPAETSTTSMSQVGPGQMQLAQEGQLEPGLEPIAMPEPALMPEPVEAPEEYDAPPLPPPPPLPRPKQQVTPEDEQLIRVLTRMAEESPATVAEIIQLWLNEDEK